MTRHINALGLKILENAEGCRLHAYPDPGSGGAPFTCGWGATGPDIHRGTVWTQAQADARLQQDMAKFEEAVSLADANVPTTDNQFSAMCDLAYNIGIGNFLGSSVLRYHRQGLHAQAASSFMMWTHAAGRELPGLVTRRKAESALYLRPDA